MTTALGTLLADRFGLSAAQTLLSSFPVPAPLSATRLRSNSTLGVTTAPVPFESAYAVHVAMQPVRGADLRIDYRWKRRVDLVPGSLILIDLERSPAGLFPHAFEFVRFGLPRATTAFLCKEQGREPPASLVNAVLHSPDKVLYHLATGLSAALDAPASANPLFVDQMLLAAHDYIVGTFGIPGPASPRGPTLSPIQVQRVVAEVDASPGKPPDIAALAALCGVSPAYFTRLFRLTAGMSPRRYLTVRRIGHAQALLLAQTLRLSEVAAACGFLSHSHFSRVFTAIVGMPPGSWSARMSRGEGPPELR